MKSVLSTIIILSALLVLSIQVSFGDDDRDEHHGALIKAKPGVEPVKNTLYEQECSSCHFAYPAGLLPEQSWRKIMSSLSDHFGENAELNAADANTIQDYLVAHSADKSGYRRSEKVMRSINESETPLRITETAYFKHEHHEIRNRLVKDNPKVGSFSQCDACHQDARQGYFSENRITIPGYGRWDD